MSLEALLKEKNRAIEALDFGKAKEIHERIERMKCTQATNYSQQMLDRLEGILAQCDEDQRKELELTEQKYAEMEREVRVQVSNIFHELQLTHIEILINIEKEYHILYIREQTRFDPYLEQRMRSSQIVANWDDFKYAQKIVQSAELEHEATLAKRIEILKQDFLKRRALIVQKQEEDMDELTDRLKRALDNLQKKFKNEVEEIKNRFRIKARKEFNSLLSEITKSKESRASKDEARQAISARFNAKFKPEMISS